MSSKERFSGEDYEFSAGSIKGLRSWGMDDLGRLHGVTHAEVWLPGENVSVCKATKLVPCPEVAKKDLAENPPSERRLQPANYYIAPTWTFYERLDPCGKDTTCDGHHHKAPVTDHTFDASCDCGFWAYDEHTFTDHGAVVGVIEGYGKTTIGTKGFRCEKAKIVALCREAGPDSAEVLSLSAWLRLQQLYPAAEFYEDFAEMVTKHGGVLRQWAPVGDDFWAQKIELPGTTLAAALQALKPGSWSV